jgi:TP901 family phage tail tape measure protein
MGFSSHEIWMVIRARDEASRLLRNVADFMTRNTKTHAADAVAAAQKIMAAERDSYNQAAEFARNRAAFDREAINRLKQNIAQERIAAKEAVANGTKTAKVARETMDANILKHQKEIQGIKAVMSADIDSNLTAQKNHLESQARHRQTIQNLQAVADKHKKSIQHMESLGQAAMIAGTGMIVAGGLMAAGYGAAIKGAIEYREAAALTFTQVDKDAQGHALVSQQAIIDMGKKVARDWPVEFKKIQPAMYDVFSSMDIASAEVAQRMIDNISKAAVAGKTDLEVAGKGITEVINAWQLPMRNATEAQKTLNRVNDVGFTLVKEGVGSYAQFSNAIGRSIPSAVKANQSYESMAGSLAFLTRMGLSTNMASTSLGRAFDLVSNPKFEANMRKYGLSTRDANNEIRPMVDIVTDLKGKMQGMSSGESADFLKKLTFGAGGTVQAMRFLNHAVHDSSGLLQKLTDDMHKAAGATDTAYKIMSETPEAKIRGLVNEFTVFKTEVGETMLQAITPVVDVLRQMFKWFNDLPGPVKTAIAVIGAIIAVFLVLGGIILLAVGGWLMIASAVASAGLAMGAVIGTISLVVVGIMAVIAAIVAVVYFWPQISQAASDAWNWIVQQWSGFTEWFGGLWNGAVAAVQNWANQALMWITNTWNGIVSWFGSLPQKMAEWWNGALIAISQFAGTASSYIQGWINQVLGFFTSGVGSWVVAFNPLVLFFTDVVPAIFDTVKAIVAGFFLIIVGIFTGNGKLIQNAWNNMGNKIKEIWTAMWNNIKSKLETAWSGLKSVFTQGMAFLSNTWTSIKNTAVNAMSALAAAVSNGAAKVLQYFRELPGKVGSALASWAGKLQATATSALAAMGTAISTGIGKAVTFFSQLPSRVASALAGFAGSMASTGRNIMMGLMNGITAMAGRIVDSVVGTIRNGINAAKRFLGINSPSKLTTQMGMFTGEGFALGIRKMYSMVSDAGKGLAESAIHPVTIPVGNGGLGRPVGGGEGSGNVYVTVNTEEIDPVKHAADLGYEIGARLAW